MATASEDDSSDEGIDGSSGPGDDPSEPDTDEMSSPRRTSVATISSIVSRSSRMPPDDQTVFRFEFMKLPFEL